MADEELVETPQCWTARRRAALVLSLLRDETSAAEAARKHGLRAQRHPQRGPVGVPLHFHLSCSPGTRSARPRPPEAALHAGGHDLTELTSVPMPVSHTPTDLTKRWDT